MSGGSSGGSSDAENGHSDGAGDDAETAGSSPQTRADTLVAVSVDAEAYARARDNAASASAVVGEDASRGAWFDAVYAQAQGDAALIPWMHATPIEVLRRWLDDHPLAATATATTAAQPIRPLALDVASGLGDHAAMLALEGYDVIGFDLSPVAVGWAQKRHASVEALSFEVADLLEAPTAWRGQFDLVHDTYTLQSMPLALLEAAQDAIAAMVKPGGRAVLITRMREADGPVDGPPFPLAPDAIERLRTGLGLVVEAEEAFTRPHTAGPVAHICLTLRKPV
ncbi:MAG: class I SAM-dependent methyltransferase [Pseudomonadota bacterium]